MVIFISLMVRHSGFMRYMPFPSAVCPKTIRRTELPGTPTLSYWHLTNSSQSHTVRLQHVSVCLNVNVMLQCLGEDAGGIRAPLLYYTPMFLDIRARKYLRVNVNTFFWGRIKSVIMCMFGVFFVAPFFLYLLLSMQFVTHRHGLF